MIFDEAVVRVPTVLLVAAAAVDLHEPDAALDHAARNEQLATEVFGLVLIEAIELLRFFIFFREINGLGRGA
ncbi:MAG: hypothetical protein AAB131_02135, partial [Actinomycetota bacterium]